MSSRLTYLAAASLLVVVNAPVTARAQAWLEDRSRAEGIGIRAGDLEIHPGIGAEIGYDSNVFLRDTDVDFMGDERPVGSALLRVTPHLFLSTLGPERLAEHAGQADRPTIDFRLGASAPFLYYFSTQQSARLEANVDAALRLLPERPVSLAIDAQYRRTARPFTSGASDSNYGRNTLSTSPGLEFRTTGGVLNAAIRGKFAYDFFDDDVTARYDSMTYGALFTSSYEFLPKTALFYEADLTYRNFENTTGAGAFRNDGTRWAFRGGLNGALSARLSATLAAGYTAPFCKAGDDADDLTATAQLRWQPTQTITATLGYDRALMTSFQGNFGRTDRVDAKFDLLAGGALLLSLHGSLSWVSYGADPNVDPDAQGPGEALRIGGDVSGEYRVADWLAFTASAAVTTNDSSASFEYVVMGVPVLDPVSFTRFEAFGGMRVFY